MTFLPKLFIISLCFCCLNSIGQTIGAQELIDSRNNILEAENDSERFEANVHFKNLIFDYCDQQSTFFKIDSIPSLGIVESPDKAWQLITWNIHNDNNTYTYFGLIQKKSKKEILNYELNDASSSIPKPFFKTLNQDKWYGCLYYQIIPIKAKGKKYYTLIGWDIHNETSHKKIIETMSFSSRGPRFGLHIFKGQKGRSQKRLIYEYKAGIQMNVKYRPKEKRIVLDHLSPSDPSLEGRHEFYGPDFIYDAYNLKKGKWYYESDVQVKGDRPEVNSINIEENTIYENGDRRKRKSNGRKIRNEQEPKPVNPEE
jgi:hypothetical protein